MNLSFTFMQDYESLVSFVLVCSCVMLSLTIQRSRAKQLVLLTVLTLAASTLMLYWFGRASALNMLWNPFVTFVIAHFLLSRWAARGDKAEAAS